MQQAGMNNPMNKMPPQSSYPDWNTGNNVGNMGGNPQLSVVTTVWGMSSSVQSGPHSSYGGNVNGGGGHMGQGGNPMGNMTGPGGYMKGGGGNPYQQNPNMQQGGYPQRFGPNGNGGPGGNLGVPVGSGGGGGNVGNQGDHHPHPHPHPHHNTYANPNALSQAAMVAATATATATATAVALQDRQDMSQYGHPSQMNMQYGVMGQQQQYNTGGQRMNGGMNNMGGMMKMNYPRGGSRPTPYPNPASHMSHKRSQQGQGHHPGTYPGPPPHQQQSHHGGGGGGMGGAYNGGTCTPACPCYKSSQFGNPPSGQYNPSGGGGGGPPPQRPNYPPQQPSYNPSPNNMGPMMGYSGSNQQGMNGMRPMRHPSSYNPNNGQYYSQMNHPMMNNQVPLNSSFNTPPATPQQQQQQQQQQSQSSHPYPPVPQQQPHHPPPIPITNQNQFVESSSNNSVSAGGNVGSSSNAVSSSGGSGPGGASRSMHSYQHSPIPGNPTPPLTPASSIPPYMSPNANGDVKPVISTKDDELRLTFPVRDGTILAPFRLEHNLAVSNHVFHLKPTVHQTLMWRSDLELQLKCFHHEDRQMNTNWPASVQVSVNAIPLTIDRGENKSSHKPLYLKDISLAGRNTLQITVTACCCSHLFVLQLVHRPSVKSVLHGLLRKRLLPSEHCVTKIKRNFNSSSSSSLNNMGSGSDGDGVEQTAIKVSLKCPITYKRITLPARGHDCKHIQCFDLESYLQLNCERGAWRCPVCNKPANLEGLEVDQYIWNALQATVSSEVEEVTIDSSANWRPSKNIAGFKMEDDHNDPCSKKIKAEIMSPIGGSWDSSGMVMSPFAPDMNSIASGSYMQGYPGNSSAHHTNLKRSSSFDFGGSDILGGPLSQLAESVNSLDALSSMEKTINEQVGMPAPPLRSNNCDGSNSSSSLGCHQQNNPHTPQTGPHTPHTPHTPGGPPSVGHNNHCTPPYHNNSSSSDGLLPDTTTSDTGLPSDLNFDPEAVINGEGSGNESLNLLPDSGVDPMELLSYLEPSDFLTGLATPPSSGESNNSNVNSTTPLGTSAPDDLLSLFD